PSTYIYKCPNIIRLSSLAWSSSSRHFLWCVFITPSNVDFVSRTTSATYPPKSGIRSVTSITSRPSYPETKQTSKWQKQQGNVGPTFNPIVSNDEGNVTCQNDISKTLSGSL